MILWHDDNNPLPEPQAIGSVVVWAIWVAVLILAAVIGVTGGTK